MKNLLVVVAILTNIAEFLIAAVYLEKFLKDCKASKTVLLTLSVLFATVLYLINICKVAYLNTIGAFMLVFVLAALCYKDRALNKLSFAIVFVAISATAEMLCGFFSFITNAVSINHFMSDDLMYILTGAIGKILMLSIIIYIRRFYGGKFYADSPKELLYLAIFPGLAVAAMTALIHITNQYSMTLSNTLVIILLLSGTLVSSIMVFFIYGQSMNRVELENELKLERETLKMNELLFRQQQNNIEELNDTKHDTKNHLNNLITLIDQKHYTDAREYCNQIFSNITTYPSLIDFNNFVLSNIYGRLLQSCKDKKIKINTTVNYTDFSFLKHSDTSKLFDNLVNNALDACETVEGGKWIDVKFTRVNQFVVIVFTNSKSHHVIVEGKDLLSTKRNYKTSGYGMKHIKEVADDYRGYVDIDYNEEEFSVLVRLFYQFD